MAACTFKRRLEHRCRFEGEEEFLSVFAESAALLSGHDELANETRTVPDVVILVILGQVENILSQQLGLRKKKNKKHEESDTTPIFVNLKLFLNVACSQTQRPSHLFGVGEIELGGQIDDLQFDNVFFVGERLGHLPQHVGGDLGDMLAVFSNQPQDAGSSHRHLEAGHI